MRAWVACLFASVSLAQAATPETPYFADRAAEWGVGFVYASGWDGRYLAPQIFGSGVGLLDYDGDGDLDIYLAQGGLLSPEENLTETPLTQDLPDALFRQDVFVTDNGAVHRRFVDVGAAAGLAADTAGVSYGMGVAVGDVDGDGLPDVYVSAFGPDRLWRNRGDGAFEDATARFGLATPAAAGWSVPALFFDYDADGRADLWLGRYLDYRVRSDVECTSPAGARDFCGPLVYEPLPDVLWHNVGGRFVDASATSGLGAAAGRALGGVAFDADSDGLMDLYVANDMGENFLWHNLGDGTFTDEALLAGTALNRRGEAEGSMGVEAQDVDGDGDDDLFMTHTTLESNTLYENRGDWLFDDRSRETGLGPQSVGHTGFGTVLFDVDLDGDLDVFVAGGAVRAIESLARRGDAFPYHEPDQLLVSDGSVFHEVQGAGVERSDTARAAAVGDLDGDGDPDLVVGHLDAPVEIFENLAAGNSWLGVRVLDAAGGDLLGTRVGLKLSDKVLWRRTRTDGGYGAAHDPRVLFGLGSAAGAAPMLELRPLGSSAPRRWRNLPTGVYLVVPVP